MKKRKPIFAAFAQNAVFDDKVLWFDTVGLPVLHLRFSRAS